MNRILSWLQKYKDTSFVFSLLALLLSCYSVYTTVSLSKKQFDLNYRPFVGVSDIKKIIDGDPNKILNKEHPPNLLEIKTTVENVGMLPASNVEIRWSWTITEAATGRTIFSDKGDEKRLTLFPKLHIVHVLRFNGTLLNDYLSNQNYNLNIRYEIFYNNVEVNKQWKSEQDFKYNQLSDLEILNSAAY